MKNIKQKKQNPNKSGANRQKDGTFGPGNNANPDGRPKGSGISITTEIKRKLEEIPKGQKATYLELLINRIFKQAIQEGDNQMIKNIWNYIDGMPQQFNDLTSRGEKIEQLIIYKPERIKEDE